MPKIRHRVVIDTNLWISFLITKDLSKLDDIIAQKNLILIFSQELLEEFIEVARRQKFKKYFSLPDLSRLLAVIDTHAEFIEVSSDVKICRDSKDDFLLSLAIDAHATHLITGDKDLLDLRTVNETKILTITDFIDDLKIK